MFLFNTKFTTGEDEKKTAGPGGIVTEMLSALDDFNIDKITEVRNEIYNSNHITEDNSKSILVILPKRQGTINAASIRQNRKNLNEFFNF